MMPEQLHLRIDDAATEKVQATVWTTAGAKCGHIVLHGSDLQDGVHDWLRGHARDLAYKPEIGWWQTDAGSPGVTLYTAEITDQEDGYRFVGHVEVRVTASTAALLARAA